MHSPRSASGQCNGLGSPASALHSPCSAYGQCNGLVDRSPEYLKILLELNLNCLYSVSALLPTVPRLSFSPSRFCVVRLGRGAWRLDGLPHVHAGQDMYTL